MKLKEQLDRLPWRKGRSSEPKLPELSLSEESEQLISISGIYMYEIHATGTLDISREDTRTLVRWEKDVDTDWGSWREFHRDLIMIDSSTGDITHTFDYEDNHTPRRTWVRKRKETRRALGNIISHLNTYRLQDPDKYAEASNAVELLKFNIE